LLCVALQVYATLTLAVGLLTLGVAADVTFHVGGTVTALASFVSLIWLGFTTPADSQVSCSNACCCCGKPMQRCMMVVLRAGT
jgi:hypothetical protein